MSGIKFKMAKSLQNRWMGSTIKFLIYSLTTIAVMLSLFAPPSTARDTVNMLGQKKWVGLLRMEGQTPVLMPFHYFLFLSLFIALREKPAISIMTLLLGCAGLTLFLAAPSFVSWLVLSDMFEKATTEPQKTLLLAAGGTILATDLRRSYSAFVNEDIKNQYLATGDALMALFDGTGWFLNNLLGGLSLLVGSLLMLRSEFYSKGSAIVGIVSNAMVCLFFIPVIGMVLLFLSVPGYMYFLHARTFFNLGRGN